MGMRHRGPGTRPTVLEQLHVAELWDLPERLEALHCCRQKQLRSCFWELAEGFQMQGRFYDHLMQSANLFHQRGVFVRNHPQQPSAVWLRGSKCFGRRQMLVARAKGTN